MSLLTDGDSAGASQKKILLIALAAILLLGIGAGLELSHWFSTTQSARAPIGAFQEEPLSLEEFLGLLAARKSSPLAQKFSEEFLKDAVLRQAWERLLHSHDVNYFVKTVGRSEGFSGLMGRFSREPGFQDLAEGLTNHPRLLRVVREFQRDFSGSARPGRVLNQPSMSSLIVPPAEFSNRPLVSSPNVPLEGDRDQVGQQQFNWISLDVAASVGVLRDSKPLAPQANTAGVKAGQATGGGNPPAAPPPPPAPPPAPPPPPAPQILRGRIPPSAP